MSINKTVGLIDCSKTLDIFKLMQTGCLKGTEVKKIFSPYQILPGHLLAQYPDMEIVEESKDIIEDESIDLVVVSKPSAREKGTIGKLLKAGKKVQILD